MESAKELSAPWLALRSRASTARNSDSLTADLEAAQRALASANLRLRGLIEASAMIVWSSDEEGNVVEDSPSWRAFTGQTFEEWRGKGWLNALHPDDRENAARVWTEATRKLTRYETTYRLKHVSGVWRWTRAKGVPILSEENRLEGWVGLNDDIHEQKLMELALSESEFRFRTLAETVPAFFWLADEQASVFYWNPSWYKFTGFTEVQSYGLNAAGAIAGEQRELILQKWLTSIKQRVDFESEIPIVSRAGEVRWFLARAKPVRDADGNIGGWAGTMVDINEQKRLAEELAQEESLREKFVATLTHDLRNALASGKTSVQLLMRYPDRPESQGKHQAMILRCLNRIDSMTTDLLDVSRIKAGYGFPLKQVTKFNLGSLAEEVCEVLNHSHPTRFITERRGDLLGEWSRDDLVRVIENLALNGLKYGAPDSPVTVAVEDQGSELILSVHNQGPPIPANQIAALFSFFERALHNGDTNKKGWGIGLTLVKSIAEAHGGTVSVCSDTRGTTFTVTLPKKAA